MEIIDNWQFIKVWAIHFKEVHRSQFTRRNNVHWLQFIWTREMHWLQFTWTREMHWLQFTIHWTWNERLEHFLMRFDPHRTFRYSNRCQDLVPPIHDWCIALSYSKFIYLFPPSFIARSKLFIWVFNQLLSFSLSILDSILIFEVNFSWRFGDCVISGACDDPFIDYSFFFLNICNSTLTNYMNCEFNYFTFVLV